MEQRVWPLKENQTPFSNFKNWDAEGSLPNTEVFLWYGRKPKHPAETHVNIQTQHKHTNPPPNNDLLEPRSFTCEATVLTAMPPCQCNTNQCAPGVEVGFSFKRCCWRLPIIADAPMKKTIDK